MPLLKNSSLSRAFLRLKNGGDAYKMLYGDFLYALIQPPGDVWRGTHKGKAYKSSILPKLYAAYSV
jgi:hypothetical protein